MSPGCPTPYKDAFPHKGEALLVARHMRQRAKRSKKGRYSPVDTYPCRCGAVHLTTKRPDVARRNR